MEIYYLFTYFDQHFFNSNDIPKKEYKTFNNFFMSLSQFINLLLSSTSMISNARKYIVLILLGILLLFFIFLLKIIEFLISKKNASDVDY